jgi:hypothetical protein
MAPIDQYLMEDREAEIALARSAAPESISRDAEILVLGRHGYETAVNGKNGFVCIVERSWTAPIDDPGFWNPKGRAPLCLNAAAVHSYLPRTIRKTDLILAGRTKAQMMEAIVAAIDKKELPRWNWGLCPTCFRSRAIDIQVNHSSRNVLGELYEDLSGGGINWTRIAGMNREFHSAVVDS